MIYWIAVHRQEPVKVGVGVEVVMVNGLVFSRDICEELNEWCLYFFIYFTLLVFQCLTQVGAWRSYGVKSMQV